MIEASVFRRVLGSYPTGVCAITATNNEEVPLGMIVGSFSSVSLDPPLVGFFPDKKSSSWAQITPVGHFCVNVLARDQGALCKQLATSGEGKFANLSHARSTNGSPILDDVIAWIDCDLHSVVDAGDHYLVLGKVTALDTGRPADPMLFFRGQYGGFATDVEVSHSG